MHLPFASLRRGPGAASRALLAAGALLASGLAGCKPEIGDKCVLSTDCSTRGDRLCDTSQPGGYCTLFNCRRNGCPEEASCVLFGAAVPGCGFDDRSGPGGARTSRSFCMATCASDADCRDGYACVDPRRAPWSAVVLDDVQSVRTCLARPADFDAQDAGGASVGAAVCGPVAPDPGPIDASAARVSDGGHDAGSVDAGVDAADAADGS